MQLPPKEWAGWIGWMMEALEDAQPDDDPSVEDILLTIERDLKQRIDTGRW